MSLSNDNNEGQRMALGEEILQIDKDGRCFDSFARFSLMDSTYSCIYNPPARSNHVN